MSSSWIFLLKIPQTLSKLYLNYQYDDGKDDSELQVKDEELTATNRSHNLKIMTNFDIK